MNENMIPKPIMLDDEKPSPELLREAFEIALQIWKLQPWDQPMGENQLLAVEHADGRRYVLSVLGEYGEHRALTIYRDVASYARIAAIPPGDEIRVQDAFFSIHQKQFAFLKANELLKGERAALKASGVKFPRGVYPSLESYVPGYATEVMGAGELTEAIAAAKVFLDFMSRHSAEDINIYRSGDLVSTWRESPDGKWALGEDEFSPLLPVAVNLSPSLLDKVAALPVNEKLNLEIGAIAVPTGKSRSGRGLMGRFMVAAEGATRFTMGLDLLDPPEGREFDWTPAVEFALKVMVKYGYRPGHLGVLGESLKGLLSGLCSTVLKGTTFLPHCECDAVREVYEVAAEQMGR